ncbi:hypothetical protein R1sor_008597 [Riccia sorocarpa]|uniref:Uncharacterized protein n=1 Tax=Riccia sorocarpa TaxID=122646 RepID=A0ABD3HY03_9MARC
MSLSTDDFDVCSRLSVAKPERYFRSTHPTELTITEARERHEQVFKDGLERLEKEMNDLRRFYLEQNGFSNSPIRNAAEDEKQQQEKQSSPAFDFAVVKTTAPQASVEALLEAGYAVSRDPPPTAQRCEKLPEYIDLFAARESAEGVLM